MEFRTEDHVVVVRRGRERSRRQRFIRPTSTKSILLVLTQLLSTIVNHFHRTPFNIHKTDLVTYG